MPRDWIYLECGDCGERWYRVDIKHRPGAREKLSLKKFCRRCRRHTVHQERKK